MNQSNVSKWLLWSLIPLGFYGFISLIGWAVVSLSTPYPVELSFWSLLWFLGIAVGWPAWWIALIVGIVLRIIVGRAEKRQQEQAQSYAEYNGWQNISQTQWKSFKGNGVVLTVVKAMHRPEYILRVDFNNEGWTAERFELAYYALQFGDYLWENVLQHAEGLSRNDLAHHRTQWNTNYLPVLRS